MKILLSQLHANAKHRPPGYYEDVCSQGVIRGIFLEITPEKYNALLEKYDTPIKGLGDVVAIPAQAIARTIDKLTGGRTSIATCGGCQRRKEKLNQMFPFK